MQLGSVVYNIVATGALGPITGAFNGVSQAITGQVVLGNDAGGTSAQLISNREIPMNGFSLAFTGIGQTATGVPIFRQSASSALTTPMLKFQNNVGAEIGRINFLGSGLQSDVYIGLNAGSAVTASGSGNTVLGNNAGVAIQSGTLCVAVGNQALTAMTTGTANVAIGQKSLNRMTTGNNFNVGVGLQTMLNLLTGNLNNTALGNGAMGNTSVAGCTDNVFIGSLSGFFTGAAPFDTAQNVCIGSQAFRNSATMGNNNVVIGYFINSTSAQNIGANNILIGANIQTSGGTIANTTLIGHDMATALSNICAVGRADQNVILGVTSPAADNGSRLQVNGDISTLVAGNALKITEGAGGRAGQVALVAGTVSIAIASVTANSRAFVTRAISNTTANTVQYRAVCTAGNLTITADLAAGTINVADISTLNYLVIN